MQQRSHALYSYKKIVNLSKGKEIIYTKLETQAYLLPGYGISFSEMRNIYHLRCRENYLKCNCSTPNPYPSPIHLVGVSIIIVKISTLLSLYYYYYSPPIKHLCRKNSIAKPPLEIST